MRRVRCCGNSLILCNSTAINTNKSILTGYFETKFIHEIFMKSKLVRNPPSVSVAIICEANERISFKLWLYFTVGRVLKFLRNIFFIFFLRIYLSFSLIWDPMRANNSNATPPTNRSRKFSNVF